MQAILNKNDLDTRLKIINSKSLKANQFLTIDTLFNKKKNIIFIAKTGYEKSMMFYSVLKLELNTMILIIMLLLMLKKNQNLVINKMQIAAIKKF